jgi:hypothetical protein
MDVGFVLLKYNTVIKTKFLQKVKVEFSEAVSTCFVVPPGNQIVNIHASKAL